MLTRLKHFLRRRRLASLGVRVEVECPCELHGRPFGGWVLNPRVLPRRPLVYSFGVGREISFDLAMIERHGAVVHAFDPTPVAIAWVRTQALPPGFVFHPVGLAAADGEQDFFAPRKGTSAHFSSAPRYLEEGRRVRAPVKRLRTLLRELGHERLDVLKMDIEGGEYDVIDDVVRDGLPAGQVLVEFHHNYATIPLQKTLDAIGKLRQAGFRIGHISDRTYEISLIHVSLLVPPG